MCAYKIVEFLSEGKQNAITSKELASRMGLKSIRELQSLVSHERAKGAVILSSSEPPGGYYLPSSPHEAAEFVRTLENRAKHTFSAVKSARAYLAGLSDDGQIALGEVP